MFTVKLFSKIKLYLYIYFLLIIYFVVVGVTNFCNRTEIQGRKPLPKRQWLHPQWPQRQVHGEQGFGRERSCTRDSIDIPVRTRS